MIKYVVGFLFDECNEKVVLVRKNRPDWQVGKYNGVGGKIERKTNGHTCYDIDCDQTNFDPCTCPWETPAEAMRREFREEAGLDLQSWKEFAVLNGSGFQVHFFSAFEPDYIVESVRTMTDEQIAISDLIDPSGDLYFPALDTIPNLQWLVPMALEHSPDKAPLPTYSIQVKYS